MKNPNERFFTPRLLAFEKAAWVLAALSFAVSLFGAMSLPEVVPIHWNIQGQIDRYGSPFESMLVFVILALAIAVMAAVLHLLDAHSWNAPAGASEQEKEHYRALSAKVIVYNEVIIAAVSLLMSFAMAALRETLVIPLALVMVVALCATYVWFWKAWKNR